MTPYLPHSSSMLLIPRGSDGKKSACNAGEASLIPGSEDLLEKGMATHCSILAWRIPWTEESMGLRRAGHDWATNSNKLVSGSQIHYENRACISCYCVINLERILLFFFFFSFFKSQVILPGSIFISRGIKAGNCLVEANRFHLQRIWFSVCLLLLIGCCVLSRTYTRNKFRVRGHYQPSCIWLIV